jgi:3-oxoacyl-[acyl-carrier-protein] synthase II
MDEDRDSFVSGEGAGAVILEKHDHAKQVERLFTKLVVVVMSAGAYRHSTIQTVWVQNVMLNCLRDRITTTRC